MKADGTYGTMLSTLICPMKDLINSAEFYFTISGVEFVNRLVFEITEAKVGEGSMERRERTADYIP
jgi:hypothetical protein